MSMMMIMYKKDFAAISDVQDALYCHNGCFLAEADSLEGADKLAVIALRNSFS
jgi:uncharacterized UPF0160 family protein